MSRSSLAATVFRATVIPVGILVVLELAGRAIKLDSYSLAIPSAIGAALFRSAGDGSLWVRTGQTLAASFTGAAIGYGIGLAIGIILGLIRPLNTLLGLTIELVRPIPPVGLIPIVIIFSGLGYTTEITLIAFGTIWPTLVLSRSAFAGIDVRLLEVAKVLQLTFVQRLFKIILPSITPQLFVAVRLAMGFALVIAITVEITTNPLGLGYSMVLAQNALNPAMMLALLLWIGIVGVCLNKLLAMVQERLFGQYSTGLLA